MKNMTVY